MCPMWTSPGKPTTLTEGLRSYSSLPCNMLGLLLIRLRLHSSAFFQFFFFFFFLSSEPCTLIMTEYLKKTIHSHIKPYRMYWCGFCSSGTSRVSLWLSQFLRLEWWLRRRVVVSQILCHIYIYLCMHCLLCLFRSTRKLGPQIYFCIGPRGSLKRAVECQVYFLCWCHSPTATIKIVTAEHYVSAR